MLIRIASERDIAEMHRIRLAVRENQLRTPALVQPDQYRSFLSTHGRGWVAEVAGGIVGFAVADLTRSNIWALFVDPAFEGRGIGRKLHDTMLDWLFAAGAACVWLTTEPGTRAEHFYRTAAWRYGGPEPSGEVRFEMYRDDWAVRARPGTV